jgi:hypothetical protein
VCNRRFAWRRVVRCPSCQDSTVEVGGPGRVAGAAADDQRTVGAATCCDFFDVVGGEVGGWVGWLLGPPWAPVTEHGAVVGDDPASALPLLGVGVEVGAPWLLGPVLVGVAVAASGLAAYWFAAVEAGAQQGAGHRLRLRLAALILTRRAQGGQRSPGPTNQARQPRQRPWAYPRRPLTYFLPTTSEEGEEGGHALRPGGCLPHLGHAGAGVGGDADDGDVVEVGPGPGDALAVG